MSKPVIIIGNGGHAAVLTEALILLEHKILGFTAPNFQKNIYSIDYLGNDDCIYQYSPNDIELVLAIGTIQVNGVREKIFKHFKEKGYSFANVKHPSCTISSTVQLGEGVQIMAGAIIQSQAQISDNCIINTGSIIEHHCVVNAHAHVAPGCKLSGGVIIGSGCHIGTGATVIQDITIGQYTLVGAGAVVIKSIGPHSKVIGVPAKEV